MNYNFVMVSFNSKTGPIPVTTTGKESCPDICPLKKNGCYAGAGRLNIHWGRLSYKGLSLNGLVEGIKSIPLGRIWRHNQAGDLASDEKGIIDSKALKAITDANKGKHGFTYTHCDPTIKSNGKAIERANKNGFTVNLSANNLEHADKLMDLNIGPVVTILPEKAITNTVTPKGRKVVVCPNYTRNVQCVDCKLCANVNRSIIIGFPAHGASKRKTEAVFNGQNAN